MDEELFNQTAYETFSEKPHMILNIMAFAGCAIGLFSDAFIIYTILMHKAMRTRINMFIAAWAMIDFFSVINEPLLGTVSDSHQTLACVVMQSGLLFPECCSLIMLFMVWEVPFKTMAITAGCLLTGDMLLNVSTCVAFGYEYTHIIYAFMELALVLLLFISIVYDLVMYCRNRSKALEFEDRHKFGVFRMNYIFWSVFYTLFHINMFGSPPVIYYLNVLVTLLSALMLVYLNLTDKKFNLYFRNIFRRVALYEVEDGTGAGRNINVS